MRKETREKKSDLLNYLEAIAKMQGNQQIGKAYYKWVLEAGKLFTEKDDPKKFNKFFEKRFKGCYYNAQMMAIDNKELKYYEGWGITEAIGIPFDHGFNAARGKVIDISWKDGIEYFGIEIPKDFIMNEMVETRIAGTILFQYWNKKINKKSRK